MSVRLSLTDAVGAAGNVFTRNALAGLHADSVPARLIPTGARAGHG